MKLSIRTRSLALAVAAGGLLTMPLALPASALASSVTCKVVTSGKITPKGPAASKFSKCTPAPFTAGTGVTPKTPPPGAKKGQLVLKITWAGGKGTTTVALSIATQASKGKCAAGTTRVKGTGKVLSATGAATAKTKKNEPASAMTCVYASGPNLGKSSLEPNTTFKV